MSVQLEAIEEQFIYYQPKWTLLDEVAYLKEKLIAAEYKLDKIHSYIRHFNSRSGGYATFLRMLRKKCKSVSALISKHFNELNKRM